MIFAASVVTRGKVPKECLQLKHCRVDDLHLAIVVAEEMEEEHAQDVARWGEGAFGC